MIIDFDKAIEGKDYSTMQYVEGKRTFKLYKGENTMPKFMKIEVEAKLILTVPSAKDDEKAGDVVLAAEQHINENSLMLMDKPTFTHVGVRIHCHDFKTLVDGKEHFDPDVRDQIGIKDEQYPSYEMVPAFDCVKNQECPDCKAKEEILEGPSGGMCTNVKCGKCGSRFNVTPFGVHRL